MMVSQLITTNQLETMSRQQRRNLERKYQKKLNSLQHQTSKSDLPLRFDNSSVTAYGSFGILEAFKKAVDLPGMLKRVSLKRHHNCKYSDTELLDTIIDALSLGLLRFSHMNALQTDPGYQKIKEVTQVPDESTLRNFVSLICEQEALDQLSLVNQELLSLKAKCDQSREVWLDIDDSVLTVFGKQEGSKVGYNPRYHGRPSYKVKVAFISGTCELVNAGLYSGNVASNGQFMEFLKETLEILANQNILVKGIRMDKGFFDEDNFAYLEEQGIEYICKAKLTSNMKKVIKYLDDQERWQPLSNHYAAAEITPPLPKWSKARRFVFIRETQEPKVSGEQLNFDLKTFDYQVIITSSDEYNPEEVWHQYNKRCNIENKIDELKVGLGFEKMSQAELDRNIAFMWLKVLSYNILNWFRLVLLDGKDSRAEVPTIRRKILNVPGNIVGNDRYRHIKLAPNPWLQKVLKNAKEKLQEFLCTQAWVAVSSG
ncbi:transposase, IS4 family [Desulforamulus reducens MI-1]|uniref:Transposase, IS4 family n=1 Tax=Desulforamulus reducens (strain ATCC BAA-1160 / DSM 100696 / MI-1) TaxID=349161 RepID=A4J6U6_DESRM|nr:IS1380-like element ISDre3 family transposase [Desulforamulus reducens]ABO50799.1 transposase, IS4 family [Desulforamulus reducens MI-1]